MRFRENISKVLDLLSKTDGKRNPVLKKHMANGIRTF
jgi:hypothetical protein